MNLNTAKKLIINLVDLVKSLTEEIVVVDNPVLSNGHAPKPLALPAPSAPPKKKAAKKATKSPKRTSTRRSPEVLEYEDEDEGDDNEPAQKTTRAVSIGEVRQSIGRFIAKMGLGQTFDGNQVRAIFDFELESTTMTAALNFWIDCGAIERIERGNPGKPSKFKKIRVMDGED